MTTKHEADEYEYSAQEQAAITYIEEAVSCEVSDTYSEYNEELRIHVYWDNDMHDVNSYHKGSVINSVMQSPAPVELKTTNDGDMAVTFIVQE